VLIGVMFWEKGVAPMASCLGDVGLWLARLGRRNYAGTRHKK